MNLVCANFKPISFSIYSTNYAVCPQKGSFTSLWTHCTDCRAVVSLFWDFFLGQKHYPISSTMRQEDGHQKKTDN